MRECSQVSIMEYFNFDPTELQVLEDIEFDETIQRPEKVRFYTLSEQTTDAYEKLLPRGRVTRFQREEVRKEIDRVQELYEAYVMALPDEYRLREPEYAKSFSWVHPIYASADQREYNWEASYTPLFENIRQPGFYPRLLDALPRPFADAGEGHPYGITEPIEFLSSDGSVPLRGLPPYSMTRTQRHEDKTITILKIPVDGTGDVVNFTGYYLDKRALEVPNPFPDHPFLKGSEAGVVTTTAPLKDVVPSMDAILTHGVPVTRDPYVEAEPYLKLYDVRLRDIPWASWKSKFPPVDVLPDAAPKEPVAFPKPAQLAPPENITSAYKTEYSPGVSVRLWLMNQMDGGGLIPALLRSRAIENGSIESVPGVDIEQAAYPPTTLEECALLGANFPDFATKGILRRNWVKDTVNYQCVPIEFIKQERARIGYVDRKPWSESTEDDIKKDYIRRLEQVRVVEEERKKVSPAPKTPMRPDSIRRAEALAVLNDPKRFADDKLRDMRDVLQDTTLTKNVYTDSDGQFVFCGHSLAILGGELEADRTKFYDTWTGRIDGHRVCKYCGEQVNSDVVVDQVQFDDAGFVIRHTEAFASSTFHGTGIASFTTGLAALRPMFLTDNAHDDTVLLLLSLLQVLPTADKLEPLLKLGRLVATVQFSKGTPAQIAKLSGMVGMATTALILQTHIPTLVPRRSFGSKALILSGYPRDSDKPGDYTIVNTLIMVLQKTFESSPTSFRGAAQQLIRATLGDSTEVKKTVTLLLSAKSPLMDPTKLKSKEGAPLIVFDMPGLFAKARAYQSEQPVREEPKTLIPVMIPPKELGVIRSFVTCPSSRPIWTSGRVPKITQDTVPLRNGLPASRGAQQVTKAISRRAELVDATPDEIRTRLAKEKGLGIQDAYRTNLAIASRLSDMFRMKEPVRNVNPEQPANRLRDVSRGILAETLHDIQRDPIKKTRFTEQRFKDVALYTLMADYKKEKAEANKLRSSERMKFVQRMAQKSDQEREVIQDLLKIGLAPYIMTNQDRSELAQEAQRLQEEVYKDDAVYQAVGDEDVGVGLPRDQFDQGDEDARGTDNGDYGDYVGMPGNDGRDHEQPQMSDDVEQSI